jgi:hypothetical protein
VQSDGVVFSAPGARSLRVRVLLGTREVFDSGPVEGARVEWDGRDEAGRWVADGVYVLQVATSDADGQITESRESIALRRAPLSSIGTMALTPKPLVGAGTLGRIPRWLGPQTLGDSVLFESAGKIGIGTTAPSSPLTVRGQIHSLLGGYKFPDNSTQITAGLPSVAHDLTLSGLGTTRSPLRIAPNRVTGVHLSANSVTGVKIAPKSVVKSLNGLFDGVTLAPGANVTITKVGNSLVIAAKVPPSGLASVAHDATLQGDGASVPLGIAPGGVGSAQLAAGAVTADKLAPGVGQVLAGGISTGQLADGAVTTPKIAPGAIGGGQIADGAIAGDKIAPGAVGSGQIAPGAVIAAHIAPGNVGGGHLVAGAVTGDKITAGAVGTTHLAPGAVTSDKLAPGVGEVPAGGIGTAQLADGAVTAPKLGAGAVTGAKIAAGQVVRSVNGVSDVVTLAAGANVTITPSGNTLTVAAPNALSSVAHDGTLYGEGTVASPLRVETPLRLHNWANTPVRGTSEFANGLEGSTQSYYSSGILGLNTAGGGSQGNGVTGRSLGALGIGVLGEGPYVGVKGVATGLYGAGVWGQSTDRPGVIGKSTSLSGVEGTSTSYYGVYGDSSTGYGVYGRSTHNVGVDGWSTYNVGVRGEGLNNDGVYGTTRAAGRSGVVGIHTGNGNGIYGENRSTGFAGHFSGRVHVNGTLSKSSGSFKIDHPLDPANKYLSHSFVESPEMMNIYNGNVTTDAKGVAKVTMPDYFSALNRDFRYQLTCIGTFAQAIVASEIKGNQFVIKTDKPRVKVSWQVTGVRQDAYANAHPIPRHRSQSRQRARCLPASRAVRAAREQGYRRDSAASAAASGPADPAVNGHTEANSPRYLKYLGLFNAFPG